MGERRASGWGSAAGWGSMISGSCEIILRIAGMETEQLLLRKP
jgi:hypothetical protein